MKRIAQTQLKSWIEKKSRKPLVIRGARQVGKTELVRLFCKDEGLDLIEINLEEHRIEEFEKVDNFNIQYAVNEILALTKKSLTNKTILFIDEIQESKKAYSRLRFFKEQMPELLVIAAGSLLEIEIKRKNVSAPVGRIEYLFIGPMTFGEFLLATKNDFLYDQINKLNYSSTKSPLNLGLHNQLLELFKQFLYVGGMPEAVKCFVESNGNFNSARDIHYQIIESYKEDIRKYADGKDESVISEVYENFCSIIGEKTKYTNLSDSKSTYVSAAIDSLRDVFVLQKVYPTNCAGMPLSAGINKKTYKLYHLDVGLYNAQMNLQWKDLTKESSESLLITKGEMAEQFIAQHLYLGSYRKRRTPIYYWLRDKNSAKAEIDFIIENQSKSGTFIPIEVKSGKTGTIKSLIQFVSEKKTHSPPIRFDLKFRENIKEQSRHKSFTGEDVSFELINLPLYAVEFLF